MPNAPLVTVDVFTRERFSGDPRTVFKMPATLTRLRGTRSPWSSAIRGAHVFAALDDIPEDPATGSGFASLAAFLPEMSDMPDVPHTIAIRQSVEQVRRGEVSLSVTKRQNRVGQHQRRLHRRDGQPPPIRQHPVAEALPSTTRRQQPPASRSRHDASAPANRAAAQYARSWRAA